LKALFHLIQGRTGKMPMRFNNQPKSYMADTGDKKKAPKITVEGAIPKLTLNMPLDTKKIKAIQKCLEKGKLTITVSKVDLAAGKVGESWIYD